MGLWGGAASRGRNEGAERLPSTQCCNSNVAWCTAHKFFSVVEDEGNVVRVWRGFPASTRVDIMVYRSQQSAVGARQRGGGQEFGGGEVFPSLPSDESRADAQH